MGMLVNGVWTDDDGFRTQGGAFVRPESSFRDRVTADGTSGFPAERGRYHLYVALSCPWAHRTLVYRALKGLEDAISLTLVGPQEPAHGWTLSGRDGAHADPINGKHAMHEVYTAAQPDYTGRATVPVLWDKRTGRIVNNESSEIIRMFDTEFDAFATRAVPRLCPPELREEIDRWNDLIYRTVNNGVYRAGFATDQAKYEEAARGVFATFDLLEKHLATHRYLCGDRITEADWRLFPTLVRFDVAYHGHFKCNLRRLIDYPLLWAYTRELYQWPGVATTVDTDAYRLGYYRGQPKVNPSRVVAIGPVLDFTAPHGRERVGAGARAAAQ
jgi:putative glutathione S-transferase